MRANLSFSAELDQILPISLVPINLKTFFHLIESSKLKILHNPINLNSSLGFLTEFSKK